MKICQPGHRMVRKSSLKSDRKAVGYLALVPIDADYYFFFQAMYTKDEIDWVSINGMYNTYF